MFGQSLQKILHSATLIGATGVLLQFSDNGGFVGVGEGWGMENRGEFGVGFEDLVQGGERFSDGVEGGGFGGGGILEVVPTFD